MSTTEGFNTLMLDRPGRLWAVAVPVHMRYDGDLQPGAQVAAELERSWEA